MNMPNSPLTGLPRCGLLRRLMVILYDSMLLAAILMFATLIALPILGDNPSAPAKLGFQLYLTLVIFGFFAWFWSHGGQTLGMLAWRVRLQNSRPGPLSLWQLLLRFLAAIASWLPLGLGFIWSLFDKDKLTWHDRFSITELVVLPKQQKK
jgi:uncharacterized RDD family membrane protein YckC